jgi:hypothetical protein
MLCLERRSNLPGYYVTIIGQISLCIYITMLNHPRG